MNSFGIIAQTDPRSPVAEAFRILRTNLKFASVDKPFRSILITSPGPQEGKSETVANMAAVIAQAGTRVIVVDCDLRYAEQHEIFGLKNENGITNVLAGGTDINKVLRKTSMPNLQVVSAGTLAPNPSELLQSEKVKDLLGQLAQMCEVLIIDSPPLLIRSDAAVLSSMADGVILVIKTGKTKVDSLVEAKDRLEQAGARILGTVMCKVKRVQ